jgi:MFS family permease
VDRALGPYLFGNLLSTMGSWFQNIAAAILVFELTGSNAAVGAVSAIQFGFILTLTLWAGGVTDRFGRKRTMIVGQTIALLGALGLTVTVLSVDAMSVWPVYAATAVIGFGMALTLPALQALVPSLVPPCDLDRTVTLNSLSFNLARGFGPVLAGWAIAAFSLSVAFAVNALSFVPLLIVLFLVRPHRAEPPASKRAHGSVAETWSWFRARPAAMALLVGAAAGGWVSDPFNTLVPALVEGWTGDKADVGLLVGCFGIGAAVSSPLVDRIRRGLGRGRLIAVGLLISAGALGLMAASPVFWTACVAAGLVGAGYLLAVTGTNTELQRGAEEGSRGRIMAFWSIAFVGIRPLAATLDGLFADLTSPRVALVIPVVVGVAAAIWLWRVAPDGDALSA